MKKIFFILFYIFIQVNCFAYELPSAPTARVMDLSDTLTESQLDTLNVRLNAIHDQESGVDLQVLIVPYIENNTTIEDFSLKYAKEWGLGQKGIDNGILLTIDTSNNTSRIEVGYGLEGVLPDSYVGTILVDNLKPNLINHNYYTGLNLTIESLDNQIKNNTYSVTYNDKRELVEKIMIIISVLLAIGVVTTFILYFAGYSNYFIVWNLLYNIALLVIQTVLSSKLIGGGGKFGGGGASN